MVLILVATGAKGVVSSKSATVGRGAVVSGLRSPVLFEEATATATVTAKVATKIIFVDWEATRRARQLALSVEKPDSYTDNTGFDYDVTIKHKQQCTENSTVLHQEDNGNVNCIITPC